MNERKIKKPEIVVFAGPNGSGKSTLTRLLMPTDIIYINADEIQRVLGCDNMQAAILAEQRREEYLREKKDFALKRFFQQSEICCFYDAPRRWATLSGAIMS